MLLFVTLSVAASLPRTFYANETDFVKIVPQAVDKDSDDINFTFTLPLDQNGEWQTTYGDAGKYQINITASDGKDQSLEEILLVIGKKNQAPVLKENKIVGKETQTINVRSLVEDPDGDPLEFTFEKPFNRNGEWETNFGDRGLHVAKFNVSDGEFNIQVRVEVEVLATNSPPVITKIFSDEETIDLKEGEKFNFFVDITDDEKDDQIRYEWSFDGKIISQSAAGSYDIDFANEGEHTFGLIIKDGINTVERKWRLQIVNVNRKPVVSHIPIVAYEAETVLLDLPAKDQDGDVLEYSYQEPFVGGEWKTNYDDAGEYDIKVTARDAQDKTEIVVHVTILNVDRAPRLELPERVEVREAEHLEWVIGAYDEDGDNLVLNVEGLPEGAILNQLTKTVTWNPDYNALTRREGVWSDFLNKIGLEHTFMQEKTLPLLVRVCGRELCDEATVSLHVFNVNRPPVMTPLMNLTFEETSQVVILPEAYDADGDIVRYTFSQPLDSDGTWDTSFNDEGTYPVQVIASDGELEVAQEFSFRVLKKNRAPEFEINDDEITVNENQEFFFPVDVTDQDGDQVTVTLHNLPAGAIFNDQGFSWNAPYTTVTNKTETFWNNLVSNSAFFNKRFNTEKEVVWLELSANDGEVEVVHPVKLTVKNVNQKPIFNTTYPQRNILVRLNEPILFYGVASDLDKDILEYTWHFSYHEPQIRGAQSIERVFTTPGIKEVVLKVNDGRDTSEYRWVVEVMNEEYIAPVETVVVPQDPFSVRVYVIEH
ncbi:hypothetical protein HYV86_07015 [Candidatus Woesearchaeota archaeon]|nr:hypothetical protein [Candidatus Woesearchaeota archaeon]